MKLILKRIIDLVGSVFLLFLFSPFFLLITLFIFIEDKSSPFFLQKRIGKKMIPFKIIKFRTMVMNAEKIDSGIFTNENDNRITRIGKFLRKYSLDELPQVINIVIGNMSFIGPRPPVTYFPYNIDEYPEEYKSRFDIKPGITGLAQISGRTNLTWPQRFEYDIKYIKEYTIIMDVKIVFKTLINILFRKDVYPTEKFQNEYHKLK